MKKILFILGLTAVVFSCKDKKAENVEQQDVKVEAVRDSAYYGTCGEGTSMHSIELVMEGGKTKTFLVDEDNGSEVLGGLFSGDKVTLTAHETEEGLIADRVVNLTSLLGQWTSLDRNFEIKQDGTVESSVEAESHPYTAWEMVNAKIVLNSDTFSVAQLGADSLSLENDKGIFVYKRQK